MDYWSDFNSIALGGVSFSHENLIFFLYKLHYSLHIPKIWGTDRWSIWLLGIVTMIWMLNCFFGFYLTLLLRQQQRLSEKTAPLNRVLLLNTYLPPKLSTQKTKHISWERWPPAWQVHLKNGIYKRNFDLHRATCLWTWVGPANLYFNAEDARYLSNKKPWEGSVAVSFMQMQFPLHSGRILGQPRRILISIVGLVVATLSVTGLYIWSKTRHISIKQTAASSQPINR